MLSAFRIEFLSRCSEPSEKAASASLKEAGFTKQLDSVFLSIIGRVAVLASRYFTIRPGEAILLGFLESLLAESLNPCIPSYGLGDSLFKDAGY